MGLVCLGFVWRGGGFCVCALGRLAGAVGFCGKGAIARFFVYEFAARWIIAQCRSGSRWIRAMSRLCSTLSVSVRMVLPDIFLDKQTHPLVLVECRLSLLQMLVLTRLFNVRGVSLSYGCALSLLGAANVTGRSFERRMCVLA